MAHNTPDTSGSPGALDLDIEQTRLWGQVEDLFLNENTVANVVWTDLGYVCSGCRYAC